MIYTVKLGDTLWGISNQFGVSVTELAKINNVTANSLQVGQILTIPKASGTNPENMFIYTVQKGDSLYNIAKKYNTTVKDIIDINNLATTNLSIGQQIRIPEKYTDEIVIPSYTNYIVEKNDTLYSIAKKFNVSVNDIIKDNNLKNNTLTVGQNLKIKTANSNIVEECFGEEYTPPSSISSFNYTVVSGDSLYKIANRYNTSVSEIIKLNNLTSNNLSIGQILKIPKNNQEKTYTVKKGDNLYSIASKFNTTVDEIKKKNKLNNNNLSIGQVLYI